MTGTFLEKDLSCLHFIIVLAAILSLTGTAHSRLQLIAASLLYLLAESFWSGAGEQLLCFQMSAVVGDPSLAVKPCTWDNTLTCHPGRSPLCVAHLALGQQRLPLHTLLLHTPCMSITVSLHSAHAVDAE